MKSDNVRNPSHYGGKENPYETIKVMRARLTPQEYVGALKFNIYKYMDRHREKNGLEDLEKAAWYQAELVRYVREVGHDAVYPKSFEEQLKMEIEVGERQHREEVA